MNEENVKIKIVLPFLRSLGFTEDDLEFEESFSIKAGRNTYLIDNTKETNSLNPRLDILVKNKTENKNLFILEIKSDQNPIGHEDIDQAISYSRLVHPIAPFSLITNGKEIKIFDTISKKEITDNFGDIKLTSDNYEIKLDVDSYYDALANFLSYSENNLRNFIQHEYQLNTKNIRGSSKEKNKIYIDDIYVPSEKLNRMFELFINHQKKVFGLVGISGMGKTCWMCNTAEKLIANNTPLFYYNFKEIKNGIFSDIVNDLNWSNDISPILNEYEAINRLLKIFSKTKVYIFLDGLDERHQENDMAIIEEFVKQIHNKNIKLVVTCKIYDWEKFIRSSRTVTKFSDELYSENENNNIKNEEERYEGIVLNELEDNQLSLIIERSRKFYNYHGKIQTTLYHEFKRNPFLLKVAFGYASKKNIEYLNNSIKELYAHYIEELLSPIKNTTLRKVFLIEITKLFYANNSPFVVLSQVIKIPNFDSRLLDEYLRWNILIKRELNGEEIIEFYFSKLRDYLISYNVAKFDTFNNVQVESFLKSVPSGIILEAFYFFYSLTDSSQKRLIDNNIYNAASNFLEEREKIINQYFNQFRSIFHPFTTGKVGLYCDVDFINNKIFSYGFRTVVNDDDKILLNPTFKKGDLRDIFQDYSITQLSMTEELPQRPDVIRKKLFKELLENIERGKQSDIPFNFNNNKFVLIERVLEYAEKYYSKELGLIKNKYISEILPLDLQDLLNLIYRTHIIDILSFDKIFRNSVYVWRPKYYIYQKLTNEEKYSINNKANEILNSEDLLNQYLSKYPLSKEDDVLNSDVKTLFSFNIYSIEDTIIPVQISNNKFSFSNMEPVTIKKIIIETTKMFLDEYQSFTLTNFSNLYTKFPLASSMPLSAYIYFNLSNPESSRFEDILFKDESILTNTVQCFDSFNIEQDNRIVTSHYAQIKKQHKIISAHMRFSHHGFFDRNNRNNYEISNRRRRWDVDILRRFLFDLLEDDLKQYLRNEKYKLLSNINIHSNFSAESFEFFVKFCEIAIEKNSIQFSSEELTKTKFQNNQNIIRHLFELEENNIITKLRYSIHKESFWFELNYFALYQYCESYISHIKEIEKKILKFILEDKKEIKNYNSQQLSDYFEIDHQILRSILFELERQKVIKLQNVLGGISWIYK
jgi:hypothetical protein